MCSGWCVERPPTPSIVNGDTGSIDSDNSDLDSAYSTDVSETRLRLAVPDTPHPPPPCGRCGLQCS